MFVPDPGYRIMDPGNWILDTRSTTTTKKEKKKIVTLTFFVATNFTKL
jgi:hypothetical protein